MRNLKALGLALVAALAMSAMAAAAAQAEKPADFAAAEYPATIDATGENVQEFTVDGQTLKCGTGTTTTGVHATATLAQESSTLTAENLSYTHCHVVVLGITFPVTVHTNGCHFQFEAGTYKAALGAEGGSEGHVTIQCPDKQEITVTVFNSGQPHTDANRRCIIHVPPQKVQGTVKYTNIKVGTKKAVTVETVNNAVTATKTDGNTFGCNAHVHDPQAEYVGAAIATGTQPVGTVIDTWVTPTG